MSLLAALVLCVVCVQAPQATVQPWTYRSPSGAVELFVDPTSRFGAGPARCRLTRAGEVQWERMVQFTFADALVEEDGSAAGYAYSRGIGSYSGELVVAGLAPDGSERGSLRWPRPAPRAPHGVLYPTVARLRLCDGGFALEIVGEGWWICDWTSVAPVRVQMEAPAAVEQGPAAAPEAMESPIPQLELTLLGRVMFPWPVPPIEPGVEKPPEEHRQRRAHRVFVDGGGRVWISELSTRRVHAFDSTGTPLFVRDPDPKHFRPYRPCDWLGVSSDGALFVCADRAIESFDASGALRPRTNFDEILPPRWWFLPDSKARWEVGATHSIRLVDPAGEISSSTERGPNGRWLEALWLSSMDVDGTLAVLDGPIGSNPRDDSQWIHFLAADAKPLRSVRLQTPVDTSKEGALTLRDGRLALLVDGQVLFLRVSDGACVGRASFPSDLRAPAFLFFSPSGRELWVFPHYRAEMWRFEVPW